MATKGAQPIMGEAGSIPAYALHDVMHVYGGRPVVKLEQWTIPQGAVIGVVGPNGCGKSTLLRLLAFVEPPTQGTILVRGEAVSWRRAQELRRRVTLLPQDPYLLDRTVGGNVAYGLCARNVRRHREARVQEALRWVGLDPRLFLSRSVRHLSGGEARRVALAARLVLQPEVLLLDEPTAAIDLQSSWRVRQAMLHARAAWGTTVVVTSHDWEWLLSVADEVYEMHCGRLVGRAPVNLFEGPWERGSDGVIWKNLGGGERLVFPAHGAGGETAVVAAEDVRVCADVPSGEAARSNVFRGTVSSLVVHGMGDRVLISIQWVGGILHASMSTDRFRAGRIQPNGCVFVEIPGHRCFWL